MGWLFDKCQVNLLIFWQSWLLPLCSCILWDFVMNSYRSVKQLFFCDLSTAFYHFNVPLERKDWKECAFFFNKSKYCFFFLCSNLIKYSDQAVCLWKVSICMEHRGITSEVVIYSPWKKNRGFIELDFVTLQCSICLNIHHASTDWSQLTTN